MSAGHERQAEESFRGDAPKGEEDNGSIAAAVPAGLARSIEQFARQCGVPASEVILAALHSLLHRYTLREHVTIDVSSPEVLPPGSFHRVCRSFTDDPGFRQLLGDSRIVDVPAALSGQDSDRLPRSFGLAALDSVAFEFGDLPNSRSRTGSYSLSVRTIPERPEWRMEFSYDNRRFDGETIERLQGHFQTLLESALAAPDREVRSLPLLTREERERILFEWNATGRERPLEPSVARLFEEQVQRTPDAVAVEFDDRRVTYRQLDRISNRLAGSLAREGVRAGVIVGLLCERGIELVAAILGIFKAGGAYLPLDSSHPLGRTVEIIRQSGIQLALASPALAPRLAFRDADRLRVIEIDGAEGSDRREEGSSQIARGDDLAYVIFTSGSTGTPKGAMIENRGMVNHLLAKIEDLALTSDDAVAQTASTCFDISVWQLLAPLLVGGRVVVIGDEIARDPRLLLRELQNGNVSIVEVVPSVLRAMIESGRDSGFPELPKLRWVIATGEALPASLTREWLARYPGIPMLNAYGPTECSDDVTHHVIRAAPSIDETDVPIGRPIANTRLYVLDASCSPVPVGIAGELFVGGDGVGRGYLNDPTRTDASFVPDPFSDSTGARLYRTGDLVRYRTDGALDYLGRTDQQVKIHGVRVELGEIEAALGRCRGVGQAVCVAPETADERWLVAYVVPQGGRSIGADEIRNDLGRNLPSHMIPREILFLKSLPLTANGKIDRKSLAAREGRARPRQSLDLPHDSCEFRLLRIWEDVLSIRPLGVRDNFFDFGGHSLLAPRLFSRIEKEFGKALPLATLVQAPTVETLAERLRGEDGEPSWSSVVVIQTGTGGLPLFCVPGVGGNILGFYDLARQLGPQQAVYGLQAQGLDGEKEPFTRVEEMAAHYISGISAILPGGPFLLAGASFGGIVAFEMARQLEEAGHDVALVALFDTLASEPWADLSRLARWKRGMRSFRQRTLRHGRNVLFGRERGKYILSKARTLRRRIRSQVWQMIYKSYRGRSKPLPKILRDVEEAGYLASKEYVPKTYRGTVTLFRAGLRPAADAGGRDMGWSRLALGGVEIREVPGDHLNMLVRPHVGLLADQLRECIDCIAASRTTESEAFGSATA